MILFWDATPIFIRPLVQRLLKPFQKVEPLRLFDSIVIVAQQMREENSMKSFSLRFTSAHVFGDTQNYGWTIAD
jgi:hypothetical protein